MLTFINKPMSGCGKGARIRPVHRPPCCHLPALRPWAATGPPPASISSAPGRGGECPSPGVDAGFTASTLVTGPEQVSVASWASLMSCCPREPPCAILHAVHCPRAPGPGAPSASLNSEDSFRPEWHLFSTHTKGACVLVWPQPPST